MITESDPAYHDLGYLSSYIRNVSDRAGGEEEGYLVITCQLAFSILKS